MKKLIKLTAIVLTLSGCQSGNVETHQTEYKLNDMVPLKLVVIDSCEYLYGPWGNATVLTHKGNCSNHKSR
jgi:hypothetical protein